MALHIMSCYFAPAFGAYSQEAFDSGTVGLADSMDLEKYQFRSGTAMPVMLQLVAWAERSDTHQLPFGREGFRKSSSPPTI
jgi:hypothetical protein